MRRMQVPIAEGTAGLRSVVKERVADLHWFTSGMTLDLLDSKYETEYELEDNAVLADGAHVIVQPATMRLPDIGVSSAVAAHARAGADPARAGESSGSLRPKSADPEGEEGGAALQDFLTNNMKKVMELFREWDEDGDGTITKKEFSRAMRQLGLQVTKDAIDKVFESFDPDGSGAIEFKELNRLVRRGTTMKINKKLMAGGAGSIEMSSRNRSSRGGLSHAHASTLRKAGGKEAQGRSSADLISPADKAHANLLSKSLSGGGLIGQLGSTLPGQHKAQLHHSMQNSALWKGTASKSLQRMQNSLLGRSAPTLLKRPSVLIAAERASQADLVPQQEKPAPLPPRGWSTAEALQIRNDRIDKYVGKIHDEELAQQEVDGLLRQTHEGVIKKQLTADEDPDGKLTKQLSKQALLLNQRAHMLSQKANETLLCARQEELDLVVPQMMDQTSQDLHEGEKFHSKLLLSQHESAVQGQQQQQR